jgi:lipopolysaccharide export system permease protein
MSTRILHRYLWGSLIRGYLPVLAILLAVFSLFVFVEEVDEVGRGRYTFWEAGAFVLLTLPERFVVLSPFIALLGSIMALGGLANGRELLAMQASGISHYQIAWAVMQVGIVFVLMIAGLEEYVTPTLDQNAHMSRSLALSDSQVYQGKQGLWFRENNRYIRIKTLKYGEIPQNIDIFEFNQDGEMVAYLYVEEADVQNSQKWILKNIQKKVINGFRVSEEALSSLAWVSPFNREEMRLLTLPASSLAPSDLFRYIGILKRKNQNVLRYELAFWGKIFMLLPDNRNIGTFRDLIRRFGILDHNHSLFRNSTSCCHHLVGVLFMKKKIFVSDGVFHASQEEDTGLICSLIFLAET